jgi:hypothetical protein
MPTQPAKHAPTSQSHGTLSSQMQRHSLANKQRPDRAPAATGRSVQGVR